MPRCLGTTRAGTRCKLPALEGEKFCRHHLPVQAVRDFLETPSLSQRIAAELRITLMRTHRQIIIVGLAFAVTFACSRDKSYLAAFIEIPHEVIIEFLSALSQALGALLGLLIAFLVLVAQTVEQQRRSAYREFKSEMGQLAHLALHRPEALAELDDGLFSIIRNLGYLRLEDLPIWLSETYHGPSWEEMVAFITKREFGRIREEMPRTAQLYFEQIIMVFTNIEDILSRLGINYI